MIQTMEGVVMLGISSERYHEVVDAVMVPKDLMTGEMLEELAELVGDSYGLHPVPHPAVVRTKDELLAFLDLLMEEERERQSEEDA